MAVINDRQRINLVNFLVTVGLLFFAVEMSSGSFATRINKISENLDRALSEMMGSQNVKFTPLTDNGTYVSDMYFNPRGMAGLYNFTNAFIDLIFSKNLYPEGFITIDNNNNLQLGDYQTEWKSLLAKYGGLLGMVILLGLIIVFMPLCGLCFCCCRCCGKCGARSQPFDKKHDLCKKIILATVLIGLGTLLLFGVVCAFVSNQQMQEGVDDLTENMRKGVKDVKTYLDTTKGQVSTLLHTNHDEFQTELLDTLNRSTEIVYGELINYSNATSMTEVANIVEAIPEIKKGFAKLKYYTNTLRVYASQLNDAVRKVKKDMLSLLQGEECRAMPECRRISNNISSLQTNIHFNNLPDITEKIDQLNEFDNSDFFEAVSNGKKKLEDVKDSIEKAVRETLNKAKEQINEAGKAIQNGANNITSIITDLQNQVETHTQTALNTADKYITRYGPYRYYVALGISCLLLLITLFVALGLICGICGKRPEGYGDDCCNKGAGSSFLICGVYFMFLTGFVVGAIVLVSFIVGVVSQRAVCDPIRDPSNSQLFELIDKVNLSQIYIDFPISTALENCYANKSIYDVFSLKGKYFDLDEVKDYLNKFHINETLAQLDIGNIDVLNNFTILGEKDRNLLTNFANSDFANVNFQEFNDSLSHSFVTVNLTILSKEIGNLINKIEDQPKASSLVESLQVNKLNIEMYQEKIVEPMIRNATGAMKLAQELSDQLNLNHSSFKDAMKVLLKELDEAEKKLNSDGINILNDTVITFTKGIVNQIQTYIDRVVDKTQYEVGQCGPISLVINATVASTCDKILLPWNGYWFGLFWSIILFIPTIIISVKLATLYQKHSAYSRDLVEARSGKSKKKNKKHKRYEDRPVPSAGGDMVTREYAAGSNHQDARYADMAPNKQYYTEPYSTSTSF